MALVRITPETAVETIQQQVREFRDAAESAGRSPALMKLKEQATGLLELVEAVQVEVEVLAIDLEPQWAAVVARWLRVDGEELVAVVRDGTDVRVPALLTHPVSVVRMRHGRKSAGRPVGERVPPVLVVAHSSTESPEEELIEEVVHEIKHRPLTLIAAPDGSGWAQALAGLGSRDAWICKFTPLEGLAEKNLEASLTRPPWQQAGQLACGWSVADALSSMHSALAVALEREGRSVQSKRAALEQQAAAAQHLGAAASPTEILGDVRGQIQKQFEAFQKGVISEFQALVAPHEGTLRLEVEGEIGAIDDFEYEKKPKVFEVKVPPAIQNGLVKRIKETLGAAGGNHVKELRELLGSVEAKVESTVVDQGGPPVSVHFDPLEQHSFDNILDRAIVLQRPYRGQLVRKGPMDFFMQARRYSMMFFMVLSAFGLSFVRQYKEITVPLGIVLLSLGLINVINQARKQAAENKEKELSKARDSLRSDLGRSMQDVQKNWTQAVSGHLAAQQAETLEGVEYAVKLAAETASRQADERKELYAKQLKGLENSQRKLTESAKKSEVATTDLKMLSEQLVEFYAGMVRPPTDAVTPGAPGVPVPNLATPSGAPAVREATPRVPGVATGGPATPAISPEAAAAMKKLEELRKKQDATPGVGTLRNGAAGGAPRPRTSKLAASASGGSGGARPGATRRAPAEAAKKGPGLNTRFEELKKKARKNKKGSSGASRRKPPAGS